MGGKVRIEVLGKGSSKGTYSLTEVADQKNTATGDNKIRSRALSIVEAKFYEAVE